MKNEDEIMGRIFMVVAIALLVFLLLFAMLSLCAFGWISTPICAPA